MKIPNWRKTLIYFLLFLSGSKIKKYLKEIKRLEDYSAKDLKRYQEKKLKAIILYAYQNVPYYQEIFDKHKLVDSDLNIDLKNFKKIPYLTKKILNKEGTRLHSTNYKESLTYLNSSGGSSGEPSHILQSKDYSDWNIANKIYYKTFVGQEIGDRELRLWGSERDTMGEKEPIKKKFKDFLYNRKDLNAFNMTEESMRSYIDFINKFKPTWIEAYTSVAYELAVFAKNNNLKIYSPRGVLVSAGTLYPHMKKIIEEVFCSKVFNRHGSREVGDLACSCPLSDKLHISMWNNYVEVIKESKNQKLGKVYVTNLNNYAMPLIRYDISDFAILSKKNNCKCGRKTLSFDRVEGREISVFKNKDGSLVPAEFFIHFIGVVFNSGEIKKFQVIQESFSEILIKYVASSDLKNTKARKKIDLIIKKTMGNNYSVKWKRVKSIRSLSSGKYLYTFSKVMTSK